MSKKQRATLIAELNALPPDALRVLLATGKLVGEGFDDFGLMTGLPDAVKSATQIMRIPAPLLCFWMGASDLNQSEVQD